MGRIDAYPVGSSSPSTGQLLALARVSTNQTGITALTDVTGLSVTVNVPAGRTLMVTGRLQVYNASGNGDMYIPIMGDGAEVGRLAYLTGTVAGYWYEVNGAAIVTPTAGTHTYKIQAQKYSGGGSMETSSSSSQPGYIVVEDITGYTAPAPVYSLPVGLLAQAIKTSTQSGLPTATWTAVTGLTANVAVPAGRTLRVRAHGHLQNTAVGGSGLRIRMDGTTTVDESYAYSTVAGSGFDVTAEGIVSPAAGAHTFTVDSWPMHGGTGTVSANADIPAFLTVEDITPTPAPAATAPSSTLGYAQVVADQGSIGVGGADLTGLTTTVTVPAGRRLRVSGKVLFKSTVANDRADLQLRDSTNDVHQISCAHLPLANAEQTCHIEAVLTPAAGTHTFKLWANRSSGTGTVTMAAAGDWPAFLQVEDVTGASLPATSYVTMAPVDATGSANTEGVSAAVARADHLHRGGVAPVTSATRPASPFDMQVIAETDTDLLKFWNGSSWVTQTNFKIHNYGAALVGTAPAVDTGSVPFKLQCGTAVLSSSAGGDSTVTFPTAFPAGLLYAAVIQGDNTHGGATWCCHSYSASSFVIRMYTASGTVWANSGNFRVNWIAIGW